MSVALSFAPSSFTKEKHDEAIKRLEAAGVGAPPGRLYHAAFEMMNGNLHVFDVWESEESFHACGATLLPILGELGVDPGQPHGALVHNVIPG